MSCLFCGILDGSVSGLLVFDEPEVVGFLDVRPVFPGHVLVVPREHHETLTDLPARLVEPLFAAARRAASAVEEAMEADGTFVAINNRVSQSVPHLHIHVVPRRRQDGLRGFFWPRLRYESDAAAETVRARIAAAMPNIDVGITDTEG